MFLLPSFVMLTACRDQPMGEQPYPVGHAPPPSRGRGRFEFEVRGWNELEVPAGVQWIEPDVGEDCVPSLGARGYISWNPNPLDVVVTYPSDQAPVPLDVAAGDVLEIPGAAPQEVPPIFRVDGVDWGWIGGSMEIVSWSPPTYEIVLRDGQTCAFRDWAVDLASCEADAGVLTFDHAPGGEFRVGGPSVGEGDRWPAPGGGFLCDTIHRPPRDDDTSDTGTN